MSLECTEEEDITTIFDELYSLFGELRELTIDNIEDNKRHKVGYFMDEVSDESLDIVRIPRLLMGIVEAKKESYGQIQNELDELLNGSISLDRELKNEEFPCRVWIKGKDFKIFYTVVEGTIIIIEGSGRIDVYSKIIPILKSPEFKDYLKRIQEYITNGGVIDAKGYTALIMSELEKSNTVKKSKQI